jgi:hypothetical protein
VIHEDFRVFAAQSHAFFILFDHLTSVEGAAGQDALNQARDRYHDICQKLYGHLAEFLAQLLLIVEGSDLRIKARLQSMNLCIPEPSCAPTPIGPFVFMGVVIALAGLAIVAVVQPPPGPLPLATTVVLIGMTKAFGVLTAVLPKLRWSAFRPDNRGNMPYLGWLVSAAVAAAGAFIIERSTFIISGHTVSAALDFGRYPLSPLAPETFVICLTIAIICDIDLQLGHGWIRRISEGLLCGTAMSAGIFVCLRLLDIPSATAGQTSFWFPFAFAFLLGFVAGFVAPYLYRREHGDEAQSRSVAMRAA